MKDLAVNGCIARRRHVLQAPCQTNVGHKHNYDHATICVLGGIEIQIRSTEDGPIESSERHYPGHDPVHIAAEKFHTIKALELGTVYFCIYPHRGHDKLMVERYCGNVEAYQ